MTSFLVLHHFQDYTTYASSVPVPSSSRHDNYDNIVDIDDRIALTGDDSDEESIPSSRVTPNSTMTRQSTPRSTRGDETPKPSLPPPSVRSMSARSLGSLASLRHRIMVKRDSAARLNVFRVTVFLVAGLLIVTAISLGLIYRYGKRLNTICMSRNILISIDLTQKIPY